ncbi:MAG: hypothetical protein M0025_08810 [Elusimicrobia bacterium]|nr:hypothetical protein [Elusimicrobiota bacterium]
MSTKLAAAALAMGLLSFVHLFGIEKAALAVALGVAALKDPALTAAGRKMAFAAITAGLLYLLVLAAVFTTHLPLLNDLAARLAH